MKIYEFSNRALNGSTPWRLLLMLSLLTTAAVMGLAIVHGQSPTGKFKRIEFLPDSSSQDSSSGSLLMSFSGGVEAKLIREGSLPLFYMDILGATVDVNPFLMNLTQGPVKLVRLNQVSHHPPVLRATFFMRKSLMPTARKTDNGVEISFSKNDLVVPEARASYSLIAPSSKGSKDAKQPVTSRFALSTDSHLPCLVEAENRGDELQQKLTVLHPEPPENLRINVKDAEAGNLMSELARQMNKAIYFRDMLGGRVNIDISASDPMQALRQIADQAGAKVTIEDGEIWVSLRQNPLLRISDSDSVEGADLSSLALGDVLRALGQIGELNIILDSSMESVREKRANVFLQKSSVRRAFETLLKVHQLTPKLVDEKTLLVMTLAKARSLEGKIIRVVPIDVPFDKLKEILEQTLAEDIKTRVVLQEDLGNLVVIGDKDAVDQSVSLAREAESKLMNAGSSLVRDYFQSLNTLPDELIATAKESLGETEKVKIIHDKRTDMVLVSGPKSNVERAMEVLRRLDLEPTRQALIHIKLIEISRSDLDNMGLKFPDQLAAFNDISKPMANSIVIPATFMGFNENNKVKTLANPTIRCMDKEEATIDISEQIPIKNTVTEYLPVASASLAARSSDNWTTQDIGIKLNIKPTIHKDNEISMQVDVDLTELLSLVEGHPWTARRVIKTMVRVKDKETVVIGGLIRTKTNKKRNPVPLLSKIPLLRRLVRRFEYRDNTDEKGEMVILITPTLVGSGGIESSPTNTLSLNSAGSEQVDARN